VTIPENKHRITYEQAQSAHARGVEVWTLACNLAHWFKLEKLSDVPETWTCAIDRTPGRTLTYDEACVHNDCGLDVEGYPIYTQVHNDWFTAPPPSTGRAQANRYRVPITEPARETAVKEEFEYVTGFNLLPFDHSDWECEHIADAWVPYQTWGTYQHRFVWNARFRRPVAKAAPTETDWRSLYEQTSEKLSISMVRIEGLKGERDAAQAALIKEREAHEKAKKELYCSRDYVTAYSQAIGEIRRASNALDDECARLYKKYK
jgi:hypothetical protein